MLNIDKKPLTLLVVDDQEITRLGLISGLENQQSNLCIIGQAENGEAAIAMAKTVNPDVILMDIFMPGVNGIEATQQIKAQNSDTKVILFTGTNQNDQEIAMAFSAGADAYCKKDIKMARLVQILEMVAEGAIWIDPAIAKTVMGILARKETLPGAQPSLRSKQERQAYNADLTERESEVLSLIVAGMSNKEIALTMKLSINTVKTHVRNVIQKMAVDDRTQAAIKSLKGE